MLKVKVLRDLEKKPVDGVHPSRGYGFADFGSHAHALAALRQVNNNPAFSAKFVAGGGGKDSEGRRPRLIVSFAIENHKALHKKKLREEKGRASQQAAAAAAAAAAASAPSVLGKRGRRAAQEEGDGAEEGATAAAAAAAEKKKSRGQRQREHKRLQKESGAVGTPKAGKGEARGSGGAGGGGKDKRGRKRKEPGGEAPPSRKQPRQPAATPPRDELDALLGDQPAGEGKKRGKKRKQPQDQRLAPEDKSFEASVSFHKQKLQLGGDGAGAGAGAGAAAETPGGRGKKGEEGRWFEGI